METAKMPVQRRHRLREEEAVADEPRDGLTLSTAAILAAAGAPALQAAVVPGLVGEAWGRLQQRRVTKWWQLVVTSTLDPDAFMARIAAGLSTDNEDVIVGVVGGGYGIGGSPRAIVIARAPARWLRDALTAAERP
jgi:hypothetical protein